MDDLFKVGDLVTGKDRSYKRSIYKVISHEGEMLSLKLVCFDGALGIGKHGDFQKARPAGKFRLATSEEVYSELAYAYKVHLLKFVKELLKIRRSSLGRRLPVQRDFLQ